MTLNDKQKNELGVDFREFAKDVDFKQLSRDENGKPINQSAADIFDDSRLDEMQKAYSYKIAFGCFKFMFWFCFLLCMALYGIYMYTEKLPCLICSYAAMAADIGVYIFYAVKTSAKGVMDNDIAEKFGKQSVPGTSAIYGLLLIGWSYIFCKNAGTEGLTALPLMAAAYSMNIIIIVCAKRNNKISSEDE
ncbi:MAG: hypothetical protein ACI4J5_05895 [Oscillospiraceae bacterium]